jgi:hypothetical protein
LHLEFTLGTFNIVKILTIRELAEDEFVALSHGHSLSRRLRQSCKDGEQMFGRYRTVRLKVPRQCCPWCNVQTEMLSERVQALEVKVGNLEKRLEIAEAVTPLTVDIDVHPFVCVNVNQEIHEDQDGLARTPYGRRPF